MSESKGRGGEGRVGEGRGGEGTAGEEGRGGEGGEGGEGTGGREREVARDVTEAEALLKKHNDLKSYITANAAK